MDPITIAALASGGGSLLTGGLNFFSQRETNEFNERSMRETNAMNSSIAQENRDWQERMWNKTNEYNSPVAQMTRLRDAGLNPMLAYGSIGEGKALGIGSPAMAHYDAPHNEAPQFSGNPIASYQQVKNMDALNVLQRAKINQTVSESESAAAQARFDKWRFKWMEDNKMLSPNPIMNLGNRGLDMLDYLGKWLGTGAANVTLQHDASHAR